VASQHRWQARSGVKYVKRCGGGCRRSDVLGPKTGEKLWEYSRGIDRTEVGSEVGENRISTGQWGIRSRPEPRRTLAAACGEAASTRLPQPTAGEGRQLTVKDHATIVADARYGSPSISGMAKYDTFNKERRGAGRCLCAGGACQKSSRPEIFWLFAGRTSRD